MGPSQVLHGGSRLSDVLCARGLGRASSGDGTAVVLGPQSRENSLKRSWKQLELEASGEDLTVHITVNQLT